MAEPSNLVIATFKQHIIPNEAASKTAGRPIFQDIEVCELRFAANRQTILVVPAHEAEPNATRQAVESGAIRPGEVLTYAQVHNEQYRQFKANEVQQVSGTPLAELPFLTEGRRRELRALNVHTAEALAALDGTPLKQLGMGGRADKDQAVAYLERARGSAMDTALASENAQLRQMLADQRELIDKFATQTAKTKFQRDVERVEAKRAAEAAEAAVEEADQTEETEEEGSPALSDAEIKTLIREATGEPVRGNPSRETLLARLAELGGQ